LRCRLWVGTAWSFSQMTPKSIRAANEHVNGRLCQQKQCSMGGLITEACVRACFIEPPWMKSNCPELQVLLPGTSYFISLSSGETPLHKDSAVVNHEQNKCLYEIIWPIKSWPYSLTPSFEVFQGRPSTC
jgi:hypothetical protein